MLKKRHKVLLLLALVGWALPLMVNADNRFYMSAIVEPPSAFDLGGIDLDVLLLLPDGTAYRRLPPDGRITDITAEELRAFNPAPLGRYTESNGRLTIEWDFTI